MSEGLVLRRTDYLETSVILNVITRDGFCSLMVKGAKRRNSEKLALSEPLTLISFEIGRPSKFPTLTEGEVSDPYFDLKADLYRFSIASVISDFAFQVKDSLVDIPSLYDLILLSLEGVRKDADPELSLFKFELLLTKLLGISIRKEYILSDYHGSYALMAALDALFKGETIRDRGALRDFFSDYFQHEMDLAPKSIKLYRELSL